MTKKHFANELITIVQGNIEKGTSTKVTVEQISTLLNVLSPINKASFSKWGTPEQQTSPEECWK